MYEDGEVPDGFHEDDDEDEVGEHEPEAAAESGEYATETASMAALFKRAITGKVKETEIAIPQLPDALQLMAWKMRISWQ